VLALLGVAVVVLGFVFRRHPLLVILAAAVVTGIASGMDPVKLVAAIGKTFTANRYLAIGWLTLPLVGVLERSGLQEQARALVSRLRTATAGRILLAYLALRQLTAALGLTSLGGQATMIRPLIAPMAEAAAERQRGRIGEALRARIRAHAAAVDNIGLFFGEDVFVAIGSILLMKGFLAQAGYDIEPFRLALYAIPTAIAAFVIHAVRLWRFDREPDA
jgi:uncharacterized membrane protein